MKSLLTNSWLNKWILFSILALLLSLVGAYFFLFALAILYPLAQMIALSKAPNSKWVWLWMLHSPLWILFVVYTDNQNVSFFEIVLYFLFVVIFGQILLRFIFGSFGKFQWIIFNSLGWILFFSFVHFFEQMDLSHGFLEILAFITTVFAQAFLSGWGIERGYL